MKSFVSSFVQSLTAFSILSSSALATPLKSLTPARDINLFPREACDNGPTSRQCWGNFSIDTNYYEEVPDTGVTREYWLSIEESECNPDGFKRYCQTINGTVPGPLITADWGDNLVIHVTNNMQTNGTSIHWHGLQQRNTTYQDGVPGVTQCAIAPGTSHTYNFRVTQYGSTWYHSHFSLQAIEGVYGGFVINGPATANYDEDLGVLFLQDWSHQTAWNNWALSASKGIPPSPANTLINGTNTFNCTGSTDANCVGGGKKFSTTFQAGKKHRLRLVNVAADAHMEFSIDGHSLTVIGADLVPIVPYTTKALQIGIGQRYDVIVEANATPGDYWLRAGISCSPSSNPIDLRAAGTGIVRYDASSTADPTTTQDITASGSCGDEDVSNLVPHLALDVENIAGTASTILSFTAASASTEGWFQWTINSSSLVLDWGEPVLKKVFAGESVFPTPYNIIRAEKSSNETKEWFVLIIDASTVGIRLDHPFHLHGHDFWILSQTSTPWDGTSGSFNFANPPRRDVANLPAGGHLAIAFQLDNPGAWIAHCHIAWHASQGLSLGFVESESEIYIGADDKEIFSQTCAAWDAYDPADMVYKQDDSGI